MRHSSSRKRLKARVAMVSAWESCRMVPWARGSLVVGRDFRPVLERGGRRLARVERVREGLVGVGVGVCTMGGYPNNGSS